MTYTVYHSPDSDTFYILIGDRLAYAGFDAMDTREITAELSMEGHTIAFDGHALIALFNGIS